MRVKYVILQQGADGTLVAVACNDTREGALEELRLIAKEGNTYHEAKVIGAPIIPKPRTGIVLSRVKQEEAKPEEKEKGKEDNVKDE